VICRRHRRQLPQWGGGAGRPCRRAPPSRGSQCLPMIARTSGADRRDRGQRRRRARRSRSRL